MSAFLSCCALWHFIICAWEWCPGGGGTQIIFWHGVWQKVWNPYPYLRISLPQKTADLTVFLEFFANRDPFLMIFLPQKWLILQFFHDFGETGPSSKDFLTKWDPCPRIFGEKVTHLGGTSPFALTCEYPPPRNGALKFTALHLPEVLHSGKEGTNL